MENRKYYHENEFWMKKSISSVINKMSSFQSGHMLKDKEQLNKIENK